MVENLQAKRPWRRGERGFTLIEVLVVTVIIGILVAEVVVSLLNAFEKSKQRATMADMRTISKAVESYNVDTGHYPAGGLTMPALSAVLVPYQSSIVPLEDHWKHQYVYASDGESAYSIESFGKDGVDGLNIDHSTRLEFERDIIISDGSFTASPDF